MGLKLKDYLSEGGYKGRIFQGYFHQKTDSKKYQNGHRKGKYFYQIRDIHSGKNPQVSLIRVDLFENEGRELSRIRSKEDTLTNHLDDKFYLTAREVPLNFNELEVKLKIKFRHY